MLESSPHPQHHLFTHKPPPRSLALNNSGENFGFDVVFHHGVNFNFRKTEKAVVWLTLVSDPCNITYLWRACDYTDNRHGHNEEQCHAACHDEEWYTREMLIYNAHIIYNNLENSFETKAVGMCFFVMKYFLYIKMYLYFVCFQ